MKLILELGTNLIPILILIFYNCLSTEDLVWSEVFVEASTHMKLIEKWVLPSIKIILQLFIYIVSRRPPFLGKGRQGSRARREGCDELQAENNGLDERVTAVIESLESLRIVIVKGVTRKVLSS